MAVTGIASCMLAVWPNLGELVLCDEKFQVCKASNACYNEGFGAKIAVRHKLKEEKK